MTIFSGWEIGQARLRESEEKLRVVVIVHGTTELTDLICVPSTGEPARCRALKKVEESDDGFLQYLCTHYVVFFDIETLDSDVGKIIPLLNEN
jgi:hypothetical protein